MQLDIPEFDIPKECQCGYKYLNSLSKNHLASNQHNFAMLERRKEAKKLPPTNGGRCDICKIDIKWNMPRHLLTNAHIRKNDEYLTYQFIEERIKLKRNEADKNRAVNKEGQEDDGDF